MAIAFDPRAQIERTHELLQRGAADEAKRLLEAEMSHDQRRGALMRAVRATVDGNTYCYLREVYDSWLVYACSLDDGPSKLFRCDYSIGDDGAVALGPAAEVRQVLTYEPVAAPAANVATEAADGSVQDSNLRESALCCDYLADLAEAASSSSPKRPLLKLIGPGWGTSGFYSAEMLKRDGPQVLTKGTKNFWDHPTATEAAVRPEGSIDRLASVLDEDARWMDDGPKGPGLYAYALPFSTHEATIRDKGPHIGVSINLAGDKRIGEAEGRKGWIVERLKKTPLGSVDYVTTSGAGGAVLTEAAKSGQPDLSPTPHTGVHSMDEKQVKALLAEALAAQKSETQSEIAKLTEAKTASESRISTLEAENKRLRKLDRVREAGTHAGKELKAAGLPDVSVVRLAKRLAIEAAEAETLDLAKLTEAAKAAAADELEYIEGVGGGSGRVRGMGSASTGSSEPTQAELDAQLTEAFKGLGMEDKSASIASRGRSGLWALLMAAILGLPFGAAQAETNRVFSPGYRLSVVASDPSAPDSGDPIRYGLMTGVAMVDEDADGNTAADFGPGVWDLYVYDEGGAGIAVGDSIYYDDTAAGDPSVNLTNSSTGAEAFFGIALEAVGTAATTQIQVMHVPVGLMSTIASNAIVSANITDGTIVSADIAADTIDGVDLADTITLDAALVLAGAVAIDIGNNTATAVTIDTDGTGDAELVLPTGSVSSTEILDATILAADQAYPGRGSFTVCGDLTTINNNTVYYGPSMALVESATVGLARACNTAATGNTTEATADEPAFTATAFQILAMDCIAQDQGATVTYTARTAAGPTVPSVTCSNADNELGCVANTQTTTAIASGATFAIAAASTADMGDVQFICTVHVAF